MSYDRNMYIGWYAEFTPTKEKIQVGEKKERVCSSDKNHKHGGGEFCGKCGSPIVSVSKPVMRGISPACHIIHEDVNSTQEYLNVMTCGRATVSDLEIFKGSEAVFPEFLYDKSKERVFASGYIYRGDICREDGFIINIPTQTPPSEKWKEAIIKVFGCTDLVVKFGMVVEVR